MLIRITDRAKWVLLQVPEDCLDRAVWQQAIEAGLLRDREDMNALLQALHAELAMAQTENLTKLRAIVEQALQPDKKERNPRLP